MLLLIAISGLWRRQTGRRAMIPALVLLTALCVLSIFFFPAHQGPYAATHGPVTELRALLPSASLFLALVLLTAGWFRPSWTFVLLEKCGALETARSLHDPPSILKVIRC